jgi:hypothetical protein
LNFANQETNARRRRRACVQRLEAHCGMKPFFFVAAARNRRGWQSFRYFIWCCIFFEHFAFNFFVRCDSMVSSKTRQEKV